MKDKQAAGHTWVGASAAAAILALPRETKRLVMATADAIAIPTALWAALALKFDRLDPVLDRTFAYFVVAAASALFFNEPVTGPKIAGVALICIGIAVGSQG